MNKELVEKMKTAYKDRGENQIGIFQLCAAVASEHYASWDKEIDLLHKCLTDLYEYPYNKESDRLQRIKECLKEIESLPHPHNNK